jgi:hypothetical protein
MLSLTTGLRSPPRIDTGYAVFDIYLNVYLETVLPNSCIYRLNFEIQSIFKESERLCLR